MGHNYTQTKLIRKDISDKTLSKNSGTNKEEKEREEIVSTKLTNSKVAG